MDRFTRLLIAAACAAVTVTAGVWLYRDTTDRAEAAELAARQEAISDDAFQRQLRSTCEDDMRIFEAGGLEALRPVYGSEARQTLAACRELLRQP